MDIRRLAETLAERCIDPSVKLWRLQNAVDALVTHFPKWKWLSIAGVGFYLYVPYDDYTRIPSGIQALAARIEGLAADGRAFVFKDRRSRDHATWIAKSTHPDLIPPVQPVPTVWDRLGSDDF